MKTLNKTECSGRINQAFKPLCKYVKNFVKERVILHISFETDNQVSISTQDVWWEINHKLKNETT